MSYRLLRPLLFRLEPERSHALALSLLQGLQRLPPLLALLRSRLLVSDPRLVQEVSGLRFANPVGLAAGFDKEGRVPLALQALGFGFLEVGTVTPDPRPGHPRPRLLRLPSDRALVNRLGFPNPGAAEAARRLRRQAPFPFVLGVNLGTARPGGSQPERDYLEAARPFASLAHYLAVNVSSPNTPGLQGLQTPQDLRRILLALRRELGPAPPLWVKLSPDLSNAQLAGLVPVLLEHAQGVIAVNTTLRRPGLSDPRAVEPGGLSGAPLLERATEVVTYLHRQSGGKLPIVGVGGVFSAEDAWRLIGAGASLVQVYTGLVYQGPGLPAAVNRGLLRRLEERGLAGLSQAVGLLAREQPA